jgi:hypothetical protein
MSFKYYFLKVFFKKNYFKVLINELEEDKQKLESCLYHFNQLNNLHKIAFEKSKIKEHRFEILNQIQGLVHEMSEELENINKNLPNKINFDEIQGHEEVISNYYKNYYSLINKIRLENEIHKNILEEINKQENFDDKEQELKINLEKEFKIDEDIFLSLQKGNRDVDEILKVLNQNIDISLDKKLKLLRKWGWDEEENSKATKLLLEEWDLCKEIAKGGDFYLFRSGIPALSKAGILTKEIIPLLIEIEKAAKERTLETYQFGLPALAKAGILTKENIPLLIEIAKAVKERTYQAYGYGLPVLAKAGMLTKEIIPLFIEISKATNENIRSLYQYGLPALANAGILTKENIPLLVEIAKAAKEHTYQAYGYGLPALAKAGILTKENIPLLIEIAKSTNENIRSLYQYGLPALAKAGILTKENIPLLIEIAKAVKERTYQAYGYGLPVLAKAGMLTKEIIPLFIEISKATNENLLSLYQYGLPALANAGILTKENIPLLVEIAKAAKEHTYQAYEYGLPIFKQIITINNHNKIVDELVWMIKKFKGDEGNNFCSLPIEIIEYLRLDYFKYLRPIIESQTVASYLCFQEIKSIFMLNALKTDEDFDLLVKIIKFKQRRAYDTLKNFINPALKQGMIEKPLSKEKDCLMEFIKQSPALFQELYKQFKLIYYSNTPNNIEHIENLFKDSKQLMKDIKEGHLSKQYNENLFYGVIYSIFSPELTVDRKMYENLIKKRDNRDSDIPSKISKFKRIEVKISRGSYVNTEEVNTEAWNNIVEAVEFVNKEKPKYDYAEVGLELLQGKMGDKLQRHKQIYSLFIQSGESLPTFSSERETLMKYKEYVGDRLKNDALTKLISLAKEKYPEKYYQLESNNTNYSGLIKQTINIWNNNVDNKEKIIINIFSRNNIPIQSLNWPENINQQIVMQTINNSTKDVIKKETIEKIFGKLCGEDYSKMQKEMSKFKFKSQGKSLFGDKFEFILSKQKLHSVAMFNFGVCVAPDDKLWNSEDFWQLIIFDNEGYAHGGCIFRTINEDNKNYLVLSIQPSLSLLGSYSADHIYSKIIQYAKVLKQKLGYEAILIPTYATIHSNRSSIQSIILEKNYPIHETNKTYSFSYSPHAYSYNSFYLV